MKNFFVKNKFKLITILLGVFIIFSPPRDPDFGWHYKYGEYIVHNRSLLRTNIFSYTATDYAWANTYWITQIIFYIFYSNLGSIVSGIFFSLLISTTVVLLLNKNLNSKEYKSGHKNAAVFTSSLLIFLLLKGFLLCCRPMLFSTIFLFFLLYTIFNRPKYLVYSPFLFLLWNNMHADFMLGLSILGVYNIYLLIRQGIKKKNLSIHLASILSLGTSLINPYGLELPKTLFKEITNFYSLPIKETLPLEDKLFIPIIVIYYVLITFTLIYLKNRKNYSWWIVVLAIYFIASVRSVYFLRIFIIIAIFPMTEFLCKMFYEINNFLYEKYRKKVIKTVKFLVIPFFISTILIFAYTVYLTTAPKKWASSFYPYEAVIFIKENPQLFEGNMFNEYSWGGYLIWQLPEHKTFVDGRMPSWISIDEQGNEIYVFKDYSEITEKPEENMNLLNKYDVSWLLINPEENLDKFLKEESIAELVFEGQNSNIWVLK